MEMILYLVLILVMCFLVVFFLVQAIVEGVKGEANVKSIFLTAIFLLVLYICMNPECLRGL